MNDSSLLIPDQETFIRYTLSVKDGLLFSSDSIIEIGEYYKLKEFDNLFTENDHYLTIHTAESLGLGDITLKFEDNKVRIDMDISGLNLNRMYEIVDSILKVLEFSPDRKEDHTPNLK